MHHLMMRSQAKELMVALKRSYIVLLVGIGTLIAGSLVLGVNASTLATEFLSNNLVIKQATIAPDGQYTTEMVSQVGGSVSVLMRGQPFEASVQGSMSDSDGTVVWKDQFNGDYIGNFDATRGEQYTIQIKNTGSEEITVDAIVGNIPFMGVGNDAKTGNVGGTLAGLGAGIIGIIILIVGGVLFFADRRAKKAVAAN